MTNFFTVSTPHSDARPTCPKCSTEMRLFGIESDRPGFELRTFQCSNCQRILTAISPIE